MKLKTDDANWMASPPAQRLNVGKTWESGISPPTSEWILRSDVRSPSWLREQRNLHYHLQHELTLKQLPLSDPWRGTAFTWPSTALMFAQCIPTVFPVFHLLGWTLPATSLFYFLSMTLHGLVWNTIHPGMCYPDKDECENAYLPSNWCTTEPHLLIMINFISSAMHGLPDVPLIVGYPSSTLKFLNGTNWIDVTRRAW